MTGLESVITTHELSRRAARAPDHAAENRAMVAIAGAMTRTPDRILDQVAKAALDLCGAHSAGFSLLDDHRTRFSWISLTGEWARHIGGGTPREFSPCGTVLDRRTALLFSHPEHYFRYLASVEPAIEEGLLLPFAVDSEIVGTIWIISHNASCRFDAEDLRVMTTLAQFAAVAYQMRRSMDALVTANRELRDSASALAQANAVAEQLRGEKHYLESELRGEQWLPELVGGSAILKEISRQIEMVAPTDTMVLLLGETGTGKELVARAIHDKSFRKDAAFIRVNCAAIPPGLLESELFGHQRGAFTGASSQKLGRIELAHRGTLFLDEVGDMALELQPKLLRVLQDQEFERLGSARTIRVDARVVAATNRNLAQMVADGGFRDDLYYRLKVFPITIPPLRDRRDDIPALVRHFVAKHARRLKRPIPRISSDVMDALIRWPWPGNVRELAHFLERAVILTHGSSLVAPLSELVITETDGLFAGTLHATERDAILRALRETGGRIGGPHGAAVRLGLKRTTLTAKMRRLGISRATVI